MKFRRGLKDASTAERLVLLAGERVASEMAFGEAYNARLDDEDTLLADSSDLAVRAVNVRWARHARRLYVEYTVHFAGPWAPRIYRWRTSVLVR